MYFFTFKTTWTVFFLQYLNGLFWSPFIVFSEINFPPLYCCLLKFLTHMYVGKHSYISKSASFSLNQCFDIYSSVLCTALSITACTVNALWKTELRMNHTLHGTNYSKNLFYYLITFSVFLSPPFSICKPGGWNGEKLDFRWFFYCNWIIGSKF